MGASSFSPSPMTTIPSIATEPSTGRIASTAAWSTRSLSPRPMNRPAAIAAASVTRTSSSARLRSTSALMVAIYPRPETAGGARRAGPLPGGHVDRYSCQSKVRVTAFFQNL